VSEFGTLGMNTPTSDWPGLRWQTRHSREGGKPAVLGPRLRGDDRIGSTQTFKVD
jgi:hypothetical protein